jgi:DNA-binding GntR family transcriptional regulator
MNERIRELSEQASEWAAANATGDWEVGPSYVDIFNKKFAELIVRECTRLVINNGIATATHDQLVRQDCVNEIKEHFGVEL